MKNIKELISFSIINFNLSGLNQSGSSEGTTLNATFEYTNLRGVNSESITNVQSIVNAPEKFANQYAQSISTNNEALSNILVDTNAITSLPDDAKISILSSRFDNKTGKIYLSFKINKYISNLGEIIDKELSFDTTIIGFKQCPDKTTVTWNNVLPDLTYYELIAELKNNPNFVTNLVTVNNMVDGATFTFAKAIEIDENASIKAKESVDKSNRFKDYQDFINNQKEALNNNENLSIDYGCNIINDD